MDYKREDAVLMTAFAFLGGCILGGVIIASPIHLPKELWSNTAAAWLQAIGTVLALGVAIAVPYRLRAADRQETQQNRKLRARSLAISIKPHLNGLSDFAVVLRGRLSIRARNYSGHSVHVVLGDTELPLPEALSGRVSELHILGEAICIPIQTALQTLGRIQHALKLGGTMRDTAEGQLWVTGPQGLDRTVSRFIAELKLANRLLDNFEAHWE